MLLHTWYCSTAHPDNLSLIGRKITMFWSNIWYCNTQPLCPNHVCPLLILVLAHHCQMMFPGWSYVNLGLFQVSCTDSKWSSLPPLLLKFVLRLQVFLSECARAATCLFGNELLGIFYNSFIWISLLAQQRYVLFFQSKKVT